VDSGSSAAADAEDREPIFLLDIAEKVLASASPLPDDEDEILLICD
jgi:hypothetical protein